MRRVFRLLLSALPFVSSTGIHHKGLRSAGSDGHRWSAEQHSLRASVDIPWSLGTFPDPKVNLDRCGRGGKKSHICDPERLLSPGLLDQEDAHLNVLKERVMGGQVPSLCQKDGWQLYIAVADELDRNYVARYESMEDGARAWATAIGHTWGVLDTPCLNGIMVVYMVRDEYVTVVTDEGAVASLLPADLARHVVHDAVRHFHNTPDHVFTTLLTDLESVLAGSYTENTLINMRASFFLCLVIGCMGLVASSLVTCVGYDVMARQRHGVRVARCTTKLQRAQEMFEHVLDGNPSRQPFPSLGQPESQEEATDSPVDHGRSLEGTGALMPLCPACLEKFPTTCSPGECNIVNHPCGHRIHTECAGVWNRARGLATTNPRCQICESSGAGSPGVDTAGLPRWGDSTTRMFVLANLHAQYPDLVTDVHVGSWVTSMPDSWLSDLGEPRYRSIFQPNE